MRQTPRAAGDRVSCLLKLQSSSRPGGCIDRDAAAQMRGSRGDGAV
jgi:hypothetical protein